MPFTIAKLHGRLILKIEGSVTVRDARELALRLDEALEEDTPVAVDAAGVEDIDTAILQLLCALRKTAAAMPIDNPSPAFLSAVERCGLRRELPGAREGL